MIKTLALAATMAALPLAAMAEVTGPTVSGTRLDIVAQGTVKRVPDVAIISAGVITTARDAKSAMASNSMRPFVRCGERYLKMAPTCTMPSPL